MRYNTEKQYHTNVLKLAIHADLYLPDNIFCTWYRAFDTEDVTSSLLYATELERLNVADWLEAIELERLNVADWLKATELQRLNVANWLDASELEQLSVEDFGLNARAETGCCLDWQVITSYHLYYLSYLQ